MIGFDSAFIEKLKDKLDIVDEIGEYCQLKKNGRNYWACCPFHSEKTPSFSVNSVDKYYHCFGCGKSGDIITFIMEQENIDFIDAVKFLAAKANIEVPEINVDNEEVKRKRQKRERLLQLLREAAVYYIKNLRTPEAEKQLTYLLDRGVNKENIKRFGLGASTDYQGVIDYLTGKGFLREEMFEAGVAGKTESNRYFDFLHGRVIIPVVNGFNNVIGFCGRMLEAKGMGKYVNTKETPVFNKGNTLFGINILKKIKKGPESPYVILVEGHMDVISLASAGYETTVASMGTALTPQQAKIIKNHRDNVYLCYDGDAPGREKAVRATFILESAGLNVKVVCLPDGADPDDVIRKQGKEAFDRLLEQAVPSVDFRLFVLEKSSDLNDIEGKRRFVREAIKIIKDSNSPSVQEELIKNLSAKTRISTQSLQKELDGTDSGKIAEPKLRESAETDSVKYAERAVLFAVMANKNFASVSDLVTLGFSSNERSTLAQTLISQREKSSGAEISLLYDITDENLKQELNAVYSVGDDFSENPSEGAVLYADCVKTMRRSDVKRKIESLKAEFSEEEDTENRKRLATLIADKLKELNALK